MAENTPTAKEIWQILKETAAIQRETKQELKEFGEGLKNTRALLDNLGKKWGDMGEALTIGDALPIFKGVGINVRSLHHNIYGSRGGDNWEIDGIAVGDDVVIVIEAKADMKKGHISTLHRQDAQAFYRA